MQTKLCPKVSLYNIANPTFRTLSLFSQNNRDFWLSQLGFKPKGIMSSFDL